METIDGPVSVRLISGKATEGVGLFEKWAGVVRFETDDSVVGRDSLGMLPITGEGPPMLIMKIWVVGL